MYVSADTFFVDFEEMMMTEEILLAKFQPELIMIIGQSFYYTSVSHSDKREFFHMGPRRILMEFMPVFGMLLLV